MSDGIYILQTLDGYRVIYSKKYYDFVNIFGDLIGKGVEDCFAGTKVYDSMVDAMDAARILSHKYGETDDGICLLKQGKNLSFLDIIGNKND
jgi:hypothetical protein